ncbi:hypothetical protein [Geobacter sulfurreducens]|uniref:hypothetical protein n=1 Tax=Geobacter sulfurreducens TaxID=35554 RepID=UPI000DBAE44F|nr:hypothetical protein [Geobacter sulfurreducens]BBA69517.1 hypothetical protein YM18_0970 [Geobacter sulfurreducens]
MTLAERIRDRCRWRRTIGCRGTVSLLTPERLLGRYLRGPMTLTPVPLVHPGRTGRLDLSLSLRFFWQTNGASAMGRCREYLPVAGGGRQGETAISPAVLPEQGPGAPTTGRGSDMAARRVHSAGGLPRYVGGEIFRTILNRVEDVMIRVRTPGRRDNGLDYPPEGKAVSRVVPVGRVTMSMSGRGGILPTSLREQSAGGDGSPHQAVRMMRRTPVGVAATQPLGEKSHTSGHHPAVVSGRSFPGGQRLPASRTRLIGTVRPLGGLAAEGERSGSAGVPARVGTASLPERGTVAGSAALDHRRRGMVSPVPADTLEKELTLTHAVAGPVSRSAHVSRPPAAVPSNAVPFAGPVAAETGRVARAPAAAVDVNRLADEVCRVIERRLVTERERRGR